MAQHKGYTRPTGRGGAGRFFRTELPHRSPENERDLGLALRACDLLFRALGARRAQGQDTHTTSDMWSKAQGMMWLMKNAPLSRLSEKQRSFLYKVLAIDAPPPVRDPIPAAARVLPLKPPMRMRTGTND